MCRHLIKTILTRVRLAVILFLVAALGVPSVAYSSGLSVLCARGDFLAVRELLEEGANPNEIDDEGHTPLTRTVLAGVEAPLSTHLKIISLLFQAGADLDLGVYLTAEDAVGTMSALHWTVYRGTRFMDMTLLLLEKGADPNLPGALGRPLHIAAGSSGVSAAHVRLLLSRGADVNATNQWGVTPLVEAVTAANPSPEKISVLLEAGADVNVVFDWGEHRGLDVLMAAAMNGSPDVVLLLLGHGAYRFSRCWEGLTAYDYALLAGRADNASLLR